MCRCDCYEAASIRSYQSNRVRALLRGPKIQETPAEVWLIEGAGHFDLIAPFAPAWTRVERAVVSLLSGR